jgi:Fe2+ transport system protein FeoA
MPTDESLPLSALRPPQKAVIIRVRANDPALLRHLESLSLIPGSEVEAAEYSSFDQNLALRIGRAGSQTCVVGFAITNQIFVQVL